MLVIVAVPLAWLLLQAQASRATRLALGVAAGLLAFGFGAVSHGLHVVTSGPDLRDITGVGFTVGGLLVVASGGAALAAPWRPPRRQAAGWRAAHAVGWLVGAGLVLPLALLPLMIGFMTTHAPRWAIDESALGISHEAVRIATTDGGKLSAWYVPSAKRDAVLVTHGSGGSRARVSAYVRMLARHGYGVLALDLRATARATDARAGSATTPSRRSTTSPTGPTSTSTESPALVSLAARSCSSLTARDSRLRAVISDGATHLADGRDVSPPPVAERVAGWLGLQAVRGISGMRPAPRCSASCRASPRGSCF